MADEKPWGPMDPNSQHQLWSKWVIRFPLTKITGRMRIVDNMRRFAKILFKSTVGEVKVDFLAKPNFATQVRIQVIIEGPPAHDPGFRDSVKAQLKKNFIEKEFGRDAAESMTLEAVILAGDSQDGKPPSQLIVIPNMVIPYVLNTP